jgi:hypothetical protein
MSEIPLCGTCEAQAANATAHTILNREGSDFRVQGLGFRISGFRVQISGFRV